MGTAVPRLTPEAFRAALLEMFAEAEEMLALARQAFLQPSPERRQRIDALARELHRREKRLTDQVVLQLREAPWSLGPIEQLAFLPAALERVGDSVEALMRCEQNLLREGLSYTELAITEVASLFSRSADLVETVAGVLRSGKADGLNAVREMGGQFEAFADQVALRHQERLVRGVCMPRASSIFLAMLDSFREIERYTRRISDALEKALAAA